MWKLYHIVPVAPAFVWYLRAAQASTEPAGHIDYILFLQLMVCPRVAARLEGPVFALTWLL